MWIRLVVNFSSAMLLIDSTSLWSNVFKLLRNKTILHSRVWLFVTPWTVVCQASLFMELSRQEYESGLPFSSPGDLPNQGIESRQSSLQTYYLLLSQQEIILKRVDIYIYTHTNIYITDSLCCAPEANVEL